MIAAGYALYGSATVIVLSFGDAPSMFMLGLFCILKTIFHLESMIRTHSVIYKNVKRY